jgi:hypothetical protein
MTRVLTTLFAEAPAGGYTYTGGSPDHPPGDPTLGWLMIAGAVAVFVFLTWVAARIGDADHPADKTPS